MLRRLRSVRSPLFLTPVPAAPPPSTSTLLFPTPKDHICLCQVYDQTYVLWRPRPNEVAAVPDACPHRGASLAMGSLVGTLKEGKCVKCPYHGLEFNAAGSCNKPNIFTGSLNVSPGLFLRAFPSELFAFRLVCSLSSVFRFCSNVLRGFAGKVNVSARLV
jgi:nitrite reductase/ring-hydroxylating ferredoxin subunit